MIRRLFWDLEVSPNIVLSWRIGREVSLRYDNILTERQIISVAWKWQGSRRVESLTWDKNQNDKKLVQEFLPVLNSADESVAHFGDSFDLKWLKGRALKHGIITLPKYHTVDTCQLARRHFYLNSVKLDYLAQFLGLEGKLHTHDGLWKRVMIDKCQKSLDFMERYNRGDVVLLEKVYEKLAPHAPHKTHAGVTEGNDRWTCPRDGSEHVKLSKTRITASGTKQFQMQCSDCGAYYSLTPKPYEQYQEHLRQ